MNHVSKLAAVGRKVVVPLLALAVLAVGAHLWLNTNVFGRDEVCGGLVSTDSAAAVFSSSGRVSDDNGLDERSGDRLAFTCTVTASSVLPGTDDERIRISASRERGDFPFTDNGRFPNPATASFFSDGATGGVGDGHGWVLLPSTCTTGAGPAVVEGYAPRGSDPVRLARLLTDVAGKAAERAGCRAKEPLRAPSALSRTPVPRPIEGGTVCGLTGLTFPGAPRPGTMESVQDRVRPTWACRIEGYATYTVTQDPQMVEAIRSSPGFEEQPPAGDRRASGFDPWHVVADCAGASTYFSLEFGPRYDDAAGTPGTPRRQDLFHNFVESAGKRLGC
ncbi:hypothetical protein RGF97_07695 [Streptomyces roseicoloratus]|uniref:Uncharacterized protein n=1 Tax=Streptomyces roseicoloratus TaxID=2508722 RepID=A0ABY9RV07_9ACTN|nr:hypothetical protein [Streptomyces roseicoloratus]WMX44760.1 hypothetical protein RGF97_07695 [Streptomyces roseicoloratus]